MPPAPTPSAVNAPSLAAPRDHRAEQPQRDEQRGLHRGHDLRRQRQRDGEEVVDQVRDVEQRHDASTTAAGRDQPAHPVRSPRRRRPSSAGSGQHGSASASHGTGDGGGTHAQLARHIVSSARRRRTATIATPGSCIGALRRVGRPAAAGCGAHPVDAVVVPGVRRVSGDLVPAGLCVGADVRRAVVDLGVAVGVDVRRLRREVRKTPVRADAQRTARPGSPATDGPRCRWCS